MSEAKDEKAAVPPAVQQIFNGPVYGVSGQTDNQTVNAGVASETVQERVPNNLPLSHARIFVGRENALTTLHQQLQGTDRVAIASVTGMGGVGKTELALQYARANASSYPAGLCWLSAREVDLGAQILAFGRKQLGLEAPDTLDNLKDQVEWFWANWRPPTGAALVVLDDVADYGTIRDYLPSETRFKVVCTTRLQTLSLGFERLPLEVLEPQDALKLLRSLAGDERVKAEPEQAVQLCGWVGWLPLGLELVGQYLHQRQTVSLGKMLERLDKKRLEQKALLGPAYDTTAQRGVREAFDLTWQDLTPEAQTVACVLSIFALAPIPWGLVEGSLSDWDEEDLEDVRDEVLVTQSLVQDSGDGLYELHQLVREFLQEKLVIQEDAEDLKRSVGKAVVRTTSQMPQTPTIKDINESIPMLTHWQEVVRQLMNYLERDYSCIYPFVSLGRFYQWQGMYEMANYWNKECLGFMIECFGKKHHMVGISLQNIAEVYRLQGNLNKAESLFLEALEIYNLTLGYCHPEIAISLSNLGAIYKARGRYDKAELLVSRALEICLAMLGKVHFLTAKNTNNLAEIYQLKKEYKKAEPLFSRALDVFRELFGEKHPEVGIVMSNLAVTYQYQGKYERAKSLLIESLEILQGDLVGGHPLTAMIMNNLAELYRLQGKYQEAKPFYLQALRNSKTILGEEHDQVAMIMNNLAELYRAQGEYEEAEYLYPQALKILREIFGEEHNQIAMIMNNLAELYRLQGKYEQAESLYLRALKILREILGEEHLDIAVILNGLSLLYQDQMIYDKSKTILLEIVNIVRNNFGEDHIYVAITNRKIASMHKLLEEYGEACQLYLEIVNKGNILFAEDPHFMVTILSDISDVLGKLEKYEIAESLYLNSLPIFLSKLGEDHPDSRTVFYDFVDCLTTAHQAGFAHTLSDHPLTQSLLQQIRENEST